MLDSINLSSPMDYYLSRVQVRLSGKYKDWGSISTSMFDFSADVPDEVIDDDFRNHILNERIDYIVTYRDSVASVVTHNDGEEFVLLNNCWLENGRWVNRGQGMADDWNDAQSQLAGQLPGALYNLPRVAVINNLPYDVAPFLAYISEITLSPEDFLLEMLSLHKVVINGEYHRRKVSWDMLKRLISRHEFPDRGRMCIYGTAIMASVDNGSFHELRSARYRSSDPDISGRAIKRLVGQRRI